jgi:CRP/FNR family cyclic AMP-dependent transcriptional regulator
MTWIEIAGYVASVFVAITFYMKTIIPLRMFAIFSNVAFIAYGFFGKIYPVLILHIFLLPLNAIRLYQMYRLVRRVRESSKGDCSMACLVPYMTKKRFGRGEVIFEKGAPGDAMYYIQSGRVQLVEIDKTAGPGEVIGEMGIFSPYKERTATARCEEDSEIYTIDEGKITQLFFQNPSFGYYLIQLSVKRFIENYIHPSSSGGSETAPDPVAKQGGKDVANSG